MSNKLDFSKVPMQKRAKDAKAEILADEELVHLIQTAINRPYGANLLLPAISRKMNAIFFKYALDKESVVKITGQLTKEFSGEPLD